MTLRSIFGTAVVVAACFIGDCSFALAQQAPSNQDLDQRLQRLERSMDQMLRLMERQQGGATTSVSDGAPRAPDAASSVSSKAPNLTSLKPGLTLDVFTLPLVEARLQDNNNFYSPRVDALPPSPTGLAAASTSFSPNGSFSYDAFQSSSATNRFSGNIAANIGLLWDGLIQIEVAGNHTVQLELSLGEDSRTGRCRASFDLNGSNIVTVMGRNDFGKATAYTEQQSRQLAVGMYKMRIWLTCSRWSNDQAANYKKVQLNVLIAGPTDRAPQPLPASRLFTQS